LIGSSISQVFFQKASKEKQQTGKTIKTFNSTFKKLLFIGIPSFAILFFTIEDLFTFIFGAKWEIAGYYAKLLIPFFFIRFIASPLSIMFTIAEKQKADCVWQIFLTLIIVMIFFINEQYNYPFRYMLIQLSIFYCFMYLVNLFLSYCFARGELS
jgi:O-antigen/teichoic acid export membrane protein